jgi:hypothetical protein
MQQSWKFSVGVSSDSAQQYCTQGFMFRSASFKEDEGTWKGNDDGKVVNNQPQRVMDDRNGLGPQGGYIGRLVMWCHLSTQTFFPRNLIHPLDILVYVVDVICLSHYLEKELLLPSALSCN